MPCEAQVLLHALWNNISVGKTCRQLTFSRCHGRICKQNKTRRSIHGASNAGTRRARQRHQKLSETSASPGSRNGRRWAQSQRQHGACSPRSFISQTRSVMILAGSRRRACGIRRSCRRQSHPLALTTTPHPPTIGLRPWAHSLPSALPAAGGSPAPS